MSSSSENPMPHDSNAAFFEDANIIAFLSTRPSTPGDTIIHIKAGPLSQLPKSHFINVLLSTKHASSIVKKATKVQRVALVTTSNSEIRLIPLHGLSPEGKPMTSPQTTYHATYPGYISSQSGPKSSNELLTKIQTQLIAKGTPPAMNKACHAPTPLAAQNLFARILRGELEQWRVWESESHVAFLTPYGNGPGKTVLVPRRYCDSDVLGLDEGVFGELMGAVWDVMVVFREADFGAQRVGLIFEGMEVEWAHVKLVPILEGNGEGRGDCCVGEQGFTERYTGEVCSLPGPVVGLEELEERLREFIDVAEGLERA